MTIHSDLTVVIPVFNAIDAVRRCIDVLVGSGFPAERIQLHDDCSTDWRFPRFLAETQEIGVVWRLHETNVGYTRNINSAIADVETEFVLIMNSDCAVTCSTIEGLRDILISIEYYGVVGPLSNQAGNQTVALAAHRFWQELQADEIIEGIGHVEGKLRWQFGRRPFFVPSVNGFCSMWRRDALLAIGSFDEENFPRGYGEEDDACFRLIEAGMLPVVAPHLFAVHFKTQSFSVAERGTLRINARKKIQEKYSEEYLNRAQNFYKRHPLFRSLAETKLDNG